MVTLLAGAIVSLSAASPLGSAGAFAVWAIALGIPGRVNARRGAGEAAGDLPRTGFRARRAPVSLATVGGARPNPILRDNVARSWYAWAGLAVSFVLLLLYTTIGLTPTPLGQAPEDRLAATNACQRAVGEDVPDARFPLTASMTSLGDGHLHLSGSVDSGSGVQAVRRNYECFLRRDPVAGEYVADSIVVWQSH